MRKTDFAPSLVRSSIAAQPRALRHGHYPHFRHEKRPPSACLAGAQGCQLPLITDSRESRSSEPRYLPTRVAETEQVAFNLSLPPHERGGGGRSCPSNVGKDKVWGAATSAHSSILARPPNPRAPAQARNKMGTAHIFQIPQIRACSSAHPKPPTEITPLVTRYRNALRRARSNRETSA